MAGKSVQTQKPTGVLDAAVLVSQLQSNCTDTRTSQPAHHLPHPARRGDLHIVVEEDEDLATRVARAEVVGGAVVEGLVPSQQGHLQVVETVSVPTLGVDP